MILYLSSLYDINIIPRTATHQQIHICCMIFIMITVLYLNTETDACTNNDQKKKKNHNT